MKKSDVSQKKYRALLAAELDARKLRNPGYSLRSFARDLSVSHSLLSRVMSGDRAVSARLILQLRDLFEPTPSAVGTPLAASVPEPAKHYASAEFFTVPSGGEFTQWYEIAIADLLTVQGAKVEVPWISQRLRLSPLQVIDAVEKLVAVGVLKESAGKLTKTRRKLVLGTRASLPAIRNIHRGFIERALETLRETDDHAFSRRRISAITMAVNPERMDEAKRRVDAFQQELLDYLTTGKCTQLYQLNMQLFPLTEG